MVLELPLSVLQSKKLKEVLRCVYQFGYADTDFNDEQVAHYPNLAEFYVSPQGITVVAKCYRPDYPMVVCALQLLPFTEDGVPQLSSDQTGVMHIPLHILKRQLADSILPDHQLTISGDIACELTGPGEPRNFSLLGNPYEEGKVAENLLSFGVEVKVGFPPHVFRDVIKNLNQLGSSVTAVIAKHAIYLRVVNINQPLSKELHWRLGSLGRSILLSCYKWGSILYQIISLPPTINNST